MRSWGRVLRCSVVLAPVLAVLATAAPGAGSTAYAAPSQAVAAPSPSVLPSAVLPPAEASAYVALPMAQRLVDTRQGGAIGVGGVLTFDITGALPLPAEGTVSAAVLNVTVLGPATAGYWTVWPHDSARPEASNINIDAAAALLGAGLAVPNVVTVPVGPSGTVDVFASGGGNLLVDFIGYYTQRADATAGRLRPLATPTRVLDTRPDSVWWPGETRDVRIAGAAGASAVVLNMTVIAFQPGYWTVFPAGTDSPPTSNLNSPTNGYVSANQVIVPVDASGTISIYSYGGGHVILDLVGTFTGSGAVRSTAGLFVPLAVPTRFLDTRVDALNPLPATQRLLPGWALEVPITTHPAVGRTDVAAVALNATLVQSLSAGYLSVTTAGASVPTAGSRPTSTLNATRAGQLIANHSIVPVSGRGFDVFSQSGGDVLADVAGYFLGAAAPAVNGRPVNVDPTPAGCTGFPVAPVSALPPGIPLDQVQVAQLRLLQLSFWHLGADGIVGLSTRQATMAFQKWAGIPATGFVDELTAVRLNTTLCRPTAGQAGDYFEVDKAKQIAKVVRGGAVIATFNVSTGNGRTYDEEDRRNAGGRAIGVAITPTGTFRIYRQSDVARYEGTLGTMYRPKFVVGGVAVHGAQSVPNYPASHGCIRVANPVMDLIWSANILPMGSRVWIHD